MKEIVLNGIFIVIYADESLMIYANRQKPKNHQKGIEQFEADSDTTLLELSAWLEQGRPEVNFNRKIRVTYWAE